MKLWPFAITALLLGAGSAFAAEKGAPLNDADCQAAWTLVSPHGAAISKDQAVPSIIDYTMVDTNKDGMIDANEFKAGCQAGWVKGK